MAIRERAGFCASLPPFSFTAAALRDVVRASPVSVVHRLARPVSARGAIRSCGRGRREKTTGFCGDDALPRLSPPPDGGGRHHRPMAAAAAASPPRHRARRRSLIFPVGAATSSSVRPLAFPTFLSLRSSKQPVRAARNSEFLSSERRRQERSAEKLTGARTGRHRRQQRRRRWGKEG